MKKIEDVMKKKYMVLVTFNNAVFIALALVR
jgi:hypothetical protein